MKQMQFRYFMGDFETTVYDGQEYTEVWASGCVELYTEDAKIFHSIDEQFNYFISLNENIVCYYHNLKFDGQFWLDYLIRKKGFKNALKQSDEPNEIRFVDRKDMPNNTITYVISDMGQWYKITVKVKNKIIEFRDSLKLLPFSVNRIGKSFKTKHQKLDIKYKGYRYAGCLITEKEREYLINDLFVVKEALEILFDEGHNKLTIGACCLHEFKSGFEKFEYQGRFPDLTKIELTDGFGCETADEYIRKSYRGGWCYVVKGKESKVFRNGTVYDVNSLYPSEMSSISGNPYPVGKPTFWRGNFIPDEALKDNMYYFIRFKSRFKIKENYLPFVQIKNSVMYKPREMLTTSDVYSYDNKKYYPEYRNIEGEIVQAKPTLTFTQTDFELFKEHYDVSELEILDGCYFRTEIGLFDEYIEKYKKIKQESEGAVRELAKLFLNNLYGKMATAPYSDFKVAYEKDDGSIGFYSIVANDKKAGYIAIGSAITSYARNFTIRTAQMNYYGADKRGFIYADTDSIHCDLSPEEMKGITVDDKEFRCWKLEGRWDEAIFVRPKTYIEHIMCEGNRRLDNPYYNVKCAGMPDRCKNLFVRSILQDWRDDIDNYSQEAIEFMKTKRDITDFKVGLVVPCKLRPMRIRGGVVLVDTTYKMREML